MSSLSSQVPVFPEFKKQPSPQSQVCRKRRKRSRWATREYPTRNPTLHQACNFFCSSSSSMWIRNLESDWLDWPFCYFKLGTNPATMTVSSSCLWILLLSSCQACWDGRHPCQSCFPSCSVLTFSRGFISCELRSSATAWLRFNQIWFSSCDDGMDSAKLMHT